MVTTDSKRIDEIRKRPEDALNTIQPESFWSDFQWLLEQLEARDAEIAELNKAGLLVSQMAVKSEARAEKYRKALEHIVTGDICPWNELVTIAEKALKDET